jgi:hypothetical protein
MPSFPRLVARPRPAPRRTPAVAKDLLLEADRGRSRRLGIWRSFSRWCVANGLEPLRDLGKAASLYIAALRADCRPPMKWGSIATYLDAIKIEYMSQGGDREGLASLCALRQREFLSLLEFMAIWAPR